MICNMNVAYPNRLSTCCGGINPWQSTPKHPTTRRAPIGSKNGWCSAPHVRACGAPSRTRQCLTRNQVPNSAAFAEGKPVRGRLSIPSYEHVTLELLVERIDPERYFSYRWHPYAVDPAVDYSTEPTTLVEFTLEDTDGGTALTIVESGFDRIPLARRAEAFRMNDNGWTGQIKQLAKYVE